MKEKAEKVSPSLMIALSFPTHHLKIIVHLSGLCGRRFRENLDVYVAGTIGPSPSGIPICASQADPYGGYFPMGHQVRVGLKEVTGGQRLEGERSQGITSLLLSCFDMSLVGNGSLVAMACCSCFSVVSVLPKPFACLGPGDSGSHCSWPVGFLSFSSHKGFLSSMGIYLFGICQVSNESQEGGSTHET